MLSASTRVARASLVALAVLVPTLSCAEVFSVESHAWRTAPPALAALIKRYEPGTFRRSESGCEPLQVLQLDGSSVQVVTTNTGCWGLAVAPLWFVSTDAKPRVLFAAGGYIIQTSYGASGYPDIDVLAAPAESTYAEHWRFDGARYAMRPSKKPAARAAK